MEKEMAKEMAKEKSDFMYPIRSTTQGSWEQELGMTKREYFAGQAMQGLSTQCISGNHNSNAENRNEEKAIHAVALADALIKALNKTS